MHRGINTRPGAVPHGGKSPWMEPGRTGQQDGLQRPQPCDPGQTFPPWFLPTSATKQEVGSDWHLPNFSHLCAKVMI